MARHAPRVRRGRYYHSHSFGAAVDEIKKQFPHISDPRGIVKKHIAWDNAHAEHDGDYRPLQVMTQTVWYGRLVFTDGRVREVDFTQPLCGTRPGWNYPTSDDEHGYMLRRNDIERAYYWKVELINLSNLLSILARLYGESCGRCGREMERGRWESGQCAPCDKEEAQEAHAWSIELPRLVRELKRAAKEAT